MFFMNYINTILNNINSTYFQQKLISLWNKKTNMFIIIITIMK